MTGQAQTKCWLDTAWPGDGFWRGFFGFYWPPLLNAPHLFTRRFWRGLRKQGERR